VLDKYGDFNGLASPAVGGGAASLGDDRSGGCKANSGNEGGGAGDGGGSGPPGSNPPGSNPPGSNPPGSGGEQCKDKIPPRSTLRQRHIKRGRHGFSVKGHSTDRGCEGKVARVYVSVAKVRRGGTCRFLQHDGSLSTTWTSCRKPVLFRARGTKRWHLKLHARGLPPGIYRVVVRAFDAAGNKERPARHRNIVRVRVR
jgi:hypothetical protein